MFAQDWNQWRGPHRTGTTTTFKPPTSWPERPKQVWKVDAGVGHSSPVVRDARVYLFSRVGEDEALTAYDLATGKQLWRQSYAAPYEMNPAARSHGKGPKATPIAHEGRVFTLGIAGTLSAFNAADGRVLWRKDFKEYPATSPAFGTAMSPAVDGNVLIAHVGGNGNGALTAFDVATGAVKWSWKGDGPAYASPIVTELAGVRQVITQSQSNVIGLSRADGRLFWQIPFTTPYEQNIVTPVVSGDVVIYGGLSKPTTAVKVRQDGGKWATEQVWASPDVPMYMSSPVLSGGTLFGHTQRNRGQFFALDVATGRILWTSPPRQGENASLVLAGDLIMATTTDSELLLMRASPSAFEVVKRYTMADSPVWAHAVPARQGVLIKDAASLAYWTF
jgi:outer membrane protein assembly factor BamB